MTTRIKQAVIGGVLGTAAMTMVMFITPMMGMPKINAAEMVSMMTGTQVAAGWIMHFMIGVIFAVVYAFIFINIVKKINSNVLRGSIFGLAVFVYAQIVMAIMGVIMGGMPPMEGSMILIMVGSILGHFVYGIAVALFVK